MKTKQLAAIAISGLILGACSFPGEKITQPKDNRPLARHTEIIGGNADRANTQIDKVYNQIASMSPDSSYKFNIVIRDIYVSDLSDLNIIYRLIYLEKDVNKTGSGSGFNKTIMLYATGHTGPATGKPAPNFGNYSRAPRLAANQPGIPLSLDLSNVILDNGYTVDADRNHKFAGELANQSKYNSSIIYAIDFATAKQGM